MGVFGSNELAIVKSTGRFGEYAYRCDVAKMVAEILGTADAMLTETARHPCSLHLHPADYQHLRMEHVIAPGTADEPGACWFYSMLVFPDAAIERGSAHLSVCPGCLYPFSICANKQVQQ